MPLLAAVLVLQRLKALLTDRTFFFVLAMMVSIYVTLFLIDSYSDVKHSYLLLHSFTFILGVTCLLKGRNCHLSRKMIASTLIFVSIIPYIAVSAGYDLVFSRVVNLQNENEKARLVSEYVRSIVMSIWKHKSFYIKLHRAESDFVKYLMMGVGGCGELAKATRTLLNLLGLESRIVEFPGEDHVFIEVKLNGSWIVVDPGYSLNLVTREDRASRRIREMGGLSYVVAHTEYGIVDLTREYVSTDLIRIRVTYNGEPLANAKIALRHKFVGSLRSLPEVYTDINGTVNMYIGPISYNKTSVEPAEPFFWIYVNGMNTGRKVNSTSSGESHYIDIEMTEKTLCGETIKVTASIIWYIITRSLSYSVHIPWKQTSIIVFFKD